MLIKEKTLNLEEFKQFYQKMTWIRAPRKLTQDHIDYFYIGNYEDDKMIVLIKIRPSMVMQISESFKGKDVNGNDQPTSTARSYTFGTTIEIRIDNNFLDKIKAEVKDVSQETMPSVSWE